MPHSLPLQLYFRPGASSSRRGDAFDRRKHRVTPHDATLPADAGMSPATFSTITKIKTMVARGEDRVGGLLSDGHAQPGPPICDGVQRSRSIELALYRAGGADIEVSVFSGGAGRNAKWSVRCVSRTERFSIRESTRPVSKSPPSTAKASPSTRRTCASATALPDGQLGQEAAAPRASVSSISGSTRSASGSTLLASTTPSSDRPRERRKIYGWEIMRPRTSAPDARRCNVGSRCRKRSAARATRRSASAPCSRDRPARKSRNDVEVEARSACCTARGSSALRAFFAISSGERDSAIRSASSRRFSVSARWSAGEPWSPFRC